MWEYYHEKITSEITKYIIHQDLKIISYKEAVNLFRTSPAFRKFFTEILKSNECKAYFWEVRPINKDVIDEEFEFVIVNSMGLSNSRANKSSFLQYLNQDKFAVSFFNISGDAKLIVPSQIGNPNHYAHIACFVRNASEEQIDSFWQKVGEEIKNSIDENWKWVSTSGLGVHWLHVRIDTKPKYYSYKPYKNIS